MKTTTYNRMFRFLAVILALAVFVMTPAGAIIIAEEAPTEFESEIAASESTSSETSQATLEMTSTTTIETTAETTAATTQKTEETNQTTFETTVAATTQAAEETTVEITQTTEGTSSDTTKTTAENTETTTTSEQTTPSSIVETSVETTQTTETTGETSGESEAEATEAEETPFASLSVEEQAERLLPLFDDEDAIFALVATLSDAQLEALIAYLETLPEWQAMMEASEADGSLTVLPPTVDFTQAGPYLGPLTYTRSADITLDNAIKVASATTSRMLRNGTSENPIISGGIGLAKTASPVDDNGQSTIRLESFTLGTVTSETVAVPLDITLVLDTSGSMDWDFPGASSRYAALNSAVENFIRGVATNAEENDVTHRVGIVQFSSGASEIARLTNIDTFENANSLISTYHKNRPPTPSGATQIDEGVNLGLDQLNNRLPVAGDPEGIDRGRVLIVFTDGYPTSSSGFELNVANRALEILNGAKSNTTVYTIGIFGGANPSQMYGDTGFFQNSDGTVGSRWYDSIFPRWSVVQVPAANRFLNLLSSNADVNTAPNIGLDEYDPQLLPRLGYTITENRTKQRNGYYLSASNAAALNDVFTSIASNLATPTIELPASTTALQDTLSPQFVLPEGFTEANIRLSTYECLGKDTNGNWVFSTAPNPSDHSSLEGVTKSVNTETKTLQIGGYNYNENFVAEDPKDGEGGSDYGRKLVVEFEIEPDPTFFGGNNVRTNTVNSGLINTTTGSQHLTFPMPVVDVPINFDYLVNNQAIYLGNLANLSQAVDFKVTDTITFKPDGVNNAYVDIEYSLLDESNTLMATYKVPAGASVTEETLHSWIAIKQRPLENKTYKINVEVKPIGSGTIEDLNIGPKEFGVQIYRPKITAEDSEIYLGETIDMEPLYTTDLGPPIVSPVLVNITWVPDTTGDVHYGDPVGDAPDIKFTKPDKVDEAVDQEQNYNLTEFAPEQDTPFSLVAELIPSTSGVSPIALMAEAAPEEAYADPESDFEFLVKLKYCELTIEKTGDIPDANQSFLFDVSNGQGDTWQVAIQGASSKTITGLPIGTYTVIEQSGWSWRYKPEVEIDSGIKLKRPTSEEPNADKVTCSFANTRTVFSWLSGESYAENVFDTNTITPAE